MSSAKSTNTPAGKLLFVGHKPSPLAKERGVTWETKNLASKTLHDALDFIDIPYEHKIINLFEDNLDKDIVDKKSLKKIRQFQKNGFAIIGMMLPVQAALSENEIPFYPLYHPATKGAIRKKELYTVHCLASITRALTSPAKTIWTKEEIWQTNPLLNPESAYRMANSISTITLAPR